MEILEAIRTKLLSEESVTDLVDDRIHKRYLHGKIVGTGNAAIVLKESGGPDIGTHNWNKPRIVVRIYSDSTRDENGMVAEEDRDDRMMVIFDVVNAVLHFTDGEVRTWSGIRFLKSEREADPHMEQDAEAMSPFLYCSYVMMVVV